MEPFRRSWPVRTGLAGPNPEPRLSDGTHPGRIRRSLISRSLSPLLTGRRGVGQAGSTRSTRSLVQCRGRPARTTPGELTISAGSHARLGGPRRMHAELGGDGFLVAVPAPASLPACRHRGRCARRGRPRASPGGRRIRGLRRERDLASGGHPRWCDGRPACGGADAGSGSERSTLPRDSRRGFVDAGFSSCSA